MKVAGSRCHDAWMGDAKRLLAGLALCSLVLAAACALPDEPPAPADGAPTVTHQPADAAPARPWWTWLNWPEPGSINILGERTKGRFGCHPDKAQVIVTLTDGARVVIYADHVRDLLSQLQPLAGRIVQLDIYEHGFPGYQEIGSGHDAIDPGEEARALGALFAPGGLMRCYGCNVAGEDPEFGNGDVRLQQIADDAGVTVEAWAEEVYYLPLAFGWTWYIDPGPGEVFVPADDVERDLPILTPSLRQVSD